MLVPQTAHSPAPGKQLHMSDMLLSSSRLGGDRNVSAPWKRSLSANLMKQPLTGITGTVPCLFQLSLSAQTKLGCSISTTSVARADSFARSTLFRWFTPPPATKKENVNSAVRTFCGKFREMLSFNHASQHRVSLSAH
mmetsp:Transcript_4720/g.13198  ORF Transcript_4720/g.13198 Transcript_4720/m.13198 type:complete len:138 (-) Transcript_4720:1502-1915(-)